MAILSEAPHQILCGQLNIAKDRTQEAGTKDFASMHGNGRGSPIRMAEKKVASASPDDFET